MKAHGTVVEGAIIEAGGDIIINRGVNGMGKGNLVAGGRVIAKFIEKNGGKGGVHHVAFAVEGLQGQLDEAAEMGIQLIDKQPRKGAEGLNIAFLHPKSTHGVLTELCEDPNK